MSHVCQHMAFVTLAQLSCVCLRSLAYSLKTLLVIEWHSKLAEEMHGRGETYTVQAVLSSARVLIIVFQSV